MQHSVIIHHDCRSRCQLRPKLGIGVVETGIPVADCVVPTESQQSIPYFLPKGWTEKHTKVEQDKGHAI